MSDQTKYTMYRKDARGTITVDLNDPVFSLDQLIEKQRVIIEDREQKITGWKSSIEHQEELLAMDEETMYRLEVARDAVRKALGQPNDREQTRGGEDG